MKISTISIHDFSPIRNFEITNLSNFVVIAGANGSGKTRLKKAIVESFQGTSVADIVIEATRPKEEEYFGGSSISISKGENNSSITGYINSRTGQGTYIGSLVQIDADRSITNIRYNPVNWFGADPDDSKSSNTYYFQPFANRWQEFINYIHQKLIARDRKIAEEVKKQQGTTDVDLMSKYPDPFEKYQKAFTEILPGKKLEPISAQDPHEFQYRDESNNVLPFSTLSSGEQEVIKVVFDVMRKDIRESVIIVDEPELHLHPALTFKLIETLRKSGGNSNQYFFLSHSADIISTYYPLGDVYFIDTQDGSGNQAKKVKDLSKNHPELLEKINNNLGVFAIGKKFIFIEGVESSSDKIMYQKINDYFNLGFTIIPLGSVENLKSLNKINEELRNSIFGIDFYMLRDKDGLSEDDISTLENANRFRCLKRRHIENYFLNSTTLAKVADQLYLDQDLRNPQYIESKLLEIAKQTINFSLYKEMKETLSLRSSIEIPKIKSPEEKTSEQIISEFKQGAEESLTLLTQQISGLTSKLDLIGKSLISDLENNSWKTTFQGKVIFDRFCGEIFHQDKQRVKDAYMDIALKDNSPDINEVKNIILSFER